MRSMTSVVLFSNTDDAGRSMLVRSMSMMSGLS